MSKTRTLMSLFAAVLLLVGTAQAGVVGYWNFDNNTNDTSGNGYNATNVGGTYAAGDVPAALAGSTHSINFNGGNNYAYVPQTAGDTAFDLPNSVAVSVWMKDFPDGDWEPIVSKRGDGGQGWQVRRRSNTNTVTFTTRGMGNDDAQGFINANTNNWKHVVATWDGNIRTVYVDGVVSRSDVIRGSISNTNSVLTFGARDDSNGGPLNITAHARIQIDDVAIYDAGLTPNQVAHLGSGGDPMSLPAPVAAPVTYTGPMVAAANGQGGYNVYAYIDPSTTWDQHRVIANGLEVNGVAGHLATIADAAENASVLGLRVGHGQTFIGATDSTSSSTLDGFDFSSLGTAENGNTSGQPPAQPNAGIPTPGQRGSGFQWVDGSPNTYQNWAGGEPNNASNHEHIAVFGSTGTWNDHNGGVSMQDGQSDYNDHAIYEFDINSPTPVVFTSHGAQIDPVTGHYIERNLEDVTWDMARVIASQTAFSGIAGHLATISDEGENEIMHLAGGSGDKWIGLTDSGAVSMLDGATMPGPEGTFGWVTGEPFGAYTRWAAGEPNDSGGEDGIVMNGSREWNDDDAGATLGDANDTKDSYLIEYEPLRKTALDGTLSYLERRRVGGMPFSGPTPAGLAEAKAFLALPSGDPSIAAEGSANIFAISFQDPQQGGGNSGWLRRPFLTDTSSPDDNFAVQAIGQLWIDTADLYTFAVYHDDNFQLKLTQNGVTVMDHINAGCCGNPTTLTAVNLAQGVVDLEFYWLEVGGGAVVQLFAAQGNYGSFDTNAFDLVGDRYNGGIALFLSPEPGTMALLAFGGLGLWRRRRRRA
ncbi:MAG: PEP-CTERM sorting domain-containing protein [Candidatus Brocadiae bacterium]|nr:PEP-CTERM sorting domain-containing protein [Candidatus Brocadiia bacterium]